MNKQANVVYRQPPPFPGFVGEADEPEALALEEEGEAQEEGTDELPVGEEDETPSEYAATEEPSAGERAAALDPKAEYVLEDGTRIKGAELKERILQAQQLEAEYQRLHPYKKLLEFYENEPEFREVVDWAGKRIYAEKVLGIPVADDDDEKASGEAGGDKTDPEEWVRKFDENPLEALDEWGKGLSGTMESRLSKMFDQALTVAQRQAVADAVWSLLEAEIGDDFPAVYEEVGRRARELAHKDPAKFAELDGNPARAARFVRQVWVEMRKSKEQPVARTERVNPASVAPAKNSVASSDVRKQKSWWDLPPDKFREMQQKILLGG